MTAITPAASVLLGRGPGSLELFAIRRSPALKFFGGFWAFPGGRLDPDDLALAGVTEPTVAALRVTACRELFEEAGVLLVRPFLTSGPELDALRRALLAGRLSFRQLLADHGLSIHADDFQPSGALTTPPFSPVRFSTQFFVASVPAGQEPAVWPGELDTGRWVTANELVQSWYDAQLLLTPPAVTILHTLDGLAIDQAPRHLAPDMQRFADGRLPEIYFAPNVRAIPLRTRALPPATHTNAFLVGALLIDPGPDEPAEQQVLLEVLSALKHEGAPIRAIVLTHHHPDHVGAATVCAQQCGVPIYAHPLTAERLAGKVTVDHLLHDGDRVGWGWPLQVLHTPGHAPGHLALYEPAYGSLFVGDMLSTQTSIVIAPPDGDLSAYLDSLRRLRALPARLLLPAHGNVSAQPQQAIDEALAHRAKREAQLLDALTAGPATIDALTPVLYRGVAESLWRFARLQIHAGLLKLQHEGRVVPLDGDPTAWRLVP